MQDRCGELGSRIDGLLDGELDPPEAQAAQAHVASCAACRAELDSRAALARALGKLVLPAPPRAIDTRFLRPRVRRFIPLSAAALFILALLVFSLRGPIPEVVAASSELHDRVVAGRVALLELGLKSAPSAHPDCPCPDLGRTSPFIVYRAGTTPISLLILESHARPDPSGPRTFRSGANSVVLFQTGKLSHLWVSRLPADELREAIPKTAVGRRLVSGEEIGLSGIT
jgi:hypothetical protein